MCEGSYDKVGNVNKGTTLSATGKSLEQIMTEIFTKELFPGTDGTVNKPTISLTTSNGNGEGGSTYNVPAATLKVTSVGSYPYAPTATGITVPATSASVSCTTAGEEANVSNESSMGLNSTLVLPAGA